VLDVDRRRTMEAEITSRAVEFINRNASTGKPFFAYVPFSLVHMPTFPNLEFAGRTGNGDWADCLAEMDYRTGQILDAIKQSKTTRSSSSPATMARRRPTLGRVMGRRSRSEDHPRVGGELQEVPPIKLGTPDPYTPEPVSR
jgi:Sulfatase